MTVESKDLLAFIVPLYPGLREELVFSADYWLMETGETSSCSVFSTACELVIRRVSAGDFDHLEQLFNGVERCLADGSEDVSTAASTCFLESLINQSEIGPLTAYFMGPLSKQHCRAWDKFTGVTTHGL
jgi:hypothetical protein